jgi:hypothetical protein
MLINTNTISVTVSVDHNYLFHQNQKQALGLYQGSLGLIATLPEGTLQEHHPNPQGGYRSPGAGVGEPG